MHHNIRPWWHMWAAGGLLHTWGPVAFGTARRWGSMMSVSSLGTPITWRRGHAERRRRNAAAGQALWEEGCSALAPGWPTLRAWCARFAWSARGWGD
eukprot:15438677-Alexandrium_andersonii.AAC.1